MTAPAWVNGYVGLPFADRGRGRDGADCWGLVRLVYAERFGIELPSFAADYRTTRDLRTVAGLFAEERKDWAQVTEGNESLCDVLLFDRRAFACHVGLWVAPGRMLHIEEGIDAVTERYDGPLWPRPPAVFRHQIMTERLGR